MYKSQLAQCLEWYRNRINVNSSFVYMSMLFLWVFVGSFQCRGHLPKHLVSRQGAYHMKQLGTCSLTSNPHNSTGFASHGSNGHYYFLLDLHLLLLEGRRQVSLTGITGTEVMPLMHRGMGSVPQIPKPHIHRSPSASFPLSYFAPLGTQFPHVKWEK